MPIGNYPSSEDCRKFGCQCDPVNVDRLRAARRYCDTLSPAAQGGWHVTHSPQGCICPVGAERTCQGAFCPRRAPVSPKPTGCNPPDITGCSVPHPSLRTDTVKVTFSEMPESLLRMTVSEVQAALRAGRPVLPDLETDPSDHGC